MMKTIHKSIILLLMYALALNPISVVLADQASGLLSNVATKQCEMEGKAHKGTKNMDDSSSSMKMADKSDCKCKNDCQQGVCGQQCADCGHFSAGLTAFTSEPGHTHPIHIKVTSDLLHQQSMLLHYRPPKALHS